jgi:hypothetical protein
LDVDTHQRRSVTGLYDAEDVFDVDQFGHAVGQETVAAATLRKISRSCPKSSTSGSLEPPAWASSLRNQSGRVVLFCGGEPRHDFEADH